MAARGVNKVILVGNVGKDPEVRYATSGNAIANITIATSDSWTDQTGQKQEKTEWHRVVFFGKLAEVVEKYVKKGSKLYVEGKLQTRKWQGQDGQDKYTTEVVVDGFGGQMQMLDSRGGDQGGYQQGGQGGGYQQPQAAPQQQYQQPAQQPAYQQPAQQQPAYQQPQAQPQAQQPAYQQPAQQAAPQQQAPAYQQPAQQRPAQQPAPQQAPATQQPPAGFDDFDDDIPF